MDTKLTEKSVQVRRWIALAFVYASVGLLLFIMLRPDVVIEFMNSLTRTGLYSIGAWRFFFGVALIAAAGASRAPGTLTILGVLGIIAGTLSPVVSVDFVRTMFQEFYGDDVGLIRGVMIVPIIVILWVGYALTPRREGAVPQQ